MHPWSENLVLYLLFLLLKQSNFHHDLHFFGFFSSKRILLLHQLDSSNLRRVHGLVQICQENVHLVVYQVHAVQGQIRDGEALTALHFYDLSMHQAFQLSQVHLLVLRQLQNWIVSVQLLSSDDIDQLGHHFIIELQIFSHCFFLKP